MNFVVVDRFEAEDGVLIRTPHIVISISGPGERRPKIPTSHLCQGILHLKFSDAKPTDNVEAPPEIRLMTRKQARSIWRFVNTYLSNIDTIMTHCHAGISRSPAVAAAICRGLGDDDSRFWREFQPNEYVYELVLEAGPGD